jgi:iron complex outermembrane receptor protein
MTATRLLSFASILLLLPLSSTGLLAAGERGVIEGRVVQADGVPLSGVEVVIDETSHRYVTSRDGRFEFGNVPVGTYSLTFRLRPHSVSRENVVVTARSTTTLEQRVGWQVFVAETVVVEAVSRRRQPIVDAPAAVTALSDTEIQPQASHGSVPKLLEFTPGVDVTQINLSDYLFNTRGFNSPLNRRVPALMDGRDMTDPFIGAMEWPIISFPNDDYAHLELVRGPTSALYGANATGGIVSITTKGPKESQGGSLRLAAGNLESINSDLRWAGALGSEWYVKVLGGIQKSEGYSVSRNETTEYSRFCEPPDIVFNCLQREAIPLPENNMNRAYGALRFDKHLANGNVITIEGGTAEYNGNVFLSIPRGQIRDVKRPWARFNFASERWNAQAWYSGRDTEATNLGNGRPFLMEAENFKVEFQTNRDFLRNKVRLVAGGSFFHETVDSPILFEAVTQDEGSVFAQADWLVNERWKLVGALRLDESNVYDLQVSPKAAVVFTINPRNTVRLTYNKAFQLPTYGEYFLFIPFTTADTTDLNAICAQDPYNIDCGLGGTTPVVISGNESLDLEQVQSFEFGYRGILGSKAVVSLELYDSINENFVIGVPQLSPTRGRANENFGDWVGPTDAEDTLIDPADCPFDPLPAGSSVADCVRAQALATRAPSQLTNFSGESILLALTNTTFGRVDTRGVDLGFQYFLTDDWRLTTTYSYFDFDIVEDDLGLADFLAPNTPEHKASVGVNYARGRWDGFIRGRWVDSFLWINSGNRGTVDSYTTADLNANYLVHKHFKIGLFVANVFDDQHWEAWSSDMLRRRVLIHGTYLW